MATVPIVVLAGQSNAEHGGMDKTIVSALTATGGAFDFVKTAEGGTSLFANEVRDWDPASSNELFADLVAAVKRAQENARAQGQDSAVTLLWVQGEADTGVSRESYRAQLSNFFEQFRSAIGTPNAAIYISTLPFDSTVRQAQYDVAAATANTYTIDTTGAQTFDGVHYNQQTAAAIASSFLSAAAFAPPSVPNFVNSVPGLIINDDGQMLSVYLPTYADNSYTSPDRQATIHGGSGSDEVTTGSAFATIFSGDGNDTIRSGGGGLSVDAGGDDDTIYGSPDGDFILGRTGDDLIYGAGGNDTVLGGDQNDRIYGGTGDDVLYGEAGADFIDTGPGIDMVDGGDGDDAIYVGANFDTSDRINGGSGNDQVGLQGNYIGLTLTPEMLVAVETLALLSGKDQRFGDTANASYTYDLTTVDATVSAGAVMTIHATGLAAGENLRFDGSAETDGAFLVFGGGGIDVVTGGAGDDAFYFGPERFGATDQVRGGGGIDQLGLDGHRDPLILDATRVDVEVVALLRGPAGNENTYGTITVAEDWVASGLTKTITAVTSFQGSSGPVMSDLVIDGHQASGNLRIFAGEGNDVLIGGAGNDILFGGAGRDTMTGGAGADTFVFNSVSDSAGLTFDTLTDFSRAADKIQVNGQTYDDYTDVIEGQLSVASFNEDLASALNQEMTGNAAVFFKASSGDYAGQTFLVVNTDGVAGYQVGQDLVLHLQPVDLSNTVATILP